MRAFSRTSAMSSSRIRPATRGVYAAPPTPDGRLWTGLPERVAPLRVDRLRAARRQDGLMTFSDPVDTQVTVAAVPGDDPTLGALVHDLSQQLPELIRSELRLAQAEVTEKGKRAGLGIGMFSVAGLLAFFGVAVLITTAILALDLVLPAWLAALIVAVVLLAAGRRRRAGRQEQVAQASPPKPERAIEGVKEDIATVKGARR